PRPTRPRRPLSRRPRRLPNPLPRPPAPPDRGPTAPRSPPSSDGYGRADAVASELQRAPRAAPRAVVPRAAGHEPAVVVGRAHPRPVPLGRQGRVGGHVPRPGPAARPGPSPPPGPAGRRPGLP